MSKSRITYSRMLEFARPYWVTLLLAVICSLLVAGLETASMYLVKTVTDDGFLNKDVAQAHRMLLLVPLGIIGVFIFKGVFSYLADVLNNGVSNRVVVDVRTRLFSKMTQLPLAYHSHQRLGQMVSRLTYDATSMQSGISDVIGRVIGSGMRMLFLVALVFYLNWKLALEVMVVFPVAMGPLYYFSRKIRRFSFQDQERMADLASLTQEILSGIRVVIAFTREDYEIGRFQAAAWRHYESLMNKLKMAALSSPVMEAIGGVGFALMVYLAGNHVVDGQMTMGGFLALVGAVASLYPQFKSLNGVNVSIQNAIAAGERVFEVLDEPVLIRNLDTAHDIQAPFQSIVFSKVDFHYVEGQSVLKDVNFEIKVGHRVALVGPSGAGKSTLADLLPRFQDVKGGAVLWDGVDIRLAKLESLRGHIGVVTQETFLFNDSIAANIAYGRPGATRPEIEAAAKAANAHDFILLQEKGYDTPIGERGVRLSGGQRQRLAIARAVLRNPPVLILDEATSALDTESEHLVQEALEHLMEKRTTLVIAHRLSTVQHADEILVIDKGGIAERGKHAALLEQGGLYARLYQMQFGRTAPEPEEAASL